MSQPSTLKATPAATRRSKSDQNHDHVAIPIPDFQIQITAPDALTVDVSHDHDHNQGVVSQLQIHHENAPATHASRTSVSIPQSLSSHATTMSRLNSASWLNFDLSQLAGEILEIVEKNNRRNCNFVPDSNKVSNLDKYFLMIKEIGSGATSRVVLAENKETHEIVALKQLKKENKYNLTAFETEYKILSQLQHPNIAQFYSCYVDNYNYYIATEYCKGGNLVDSIRKFKYFSERQVVTYLNTIINTVKYLHSKNIIHRDLKPGNLVFDKVVSMDTDHGIERDTDHKTDSNSLSLSTASNKPRNINNNINNNNNGNSNYNYKKRQSIAQLKLIDFGVAIEIDDEEINDDYVGTLVYLPPESVGQRTGQILKAGDMWSIGVIAYILVCGIPPFFGHDHSSTLAKILVQDVEWPPKIELTKECKDFIEKLLKKNPKKRLTAHEALNHEWLKNEMDAANTNLSTTFSENIANFDSTGMCSLYFSLYLYLIEKQKHICLLYTCRKI